MLRTVTATSHFGDTPRRAQIPSKSCVVLLDAVIHADTPSLSRAAVLAYSALGGERCSGEI